MEKKSENLTNAILVIAFVIACVIWWGVLKNVVLFLVTLGVLVFIHEWGHFVAARSVGVHCYEFALGFGPKLMTYMRRNGTEYTVRAVPLGGFVNIKGMQPEDPIMPDGLNSKRPAEKALVYLAGPLMNVILALVIFTLKGAVFGTPDLTQVLVGNVVKRSVAQKLPIVSKDGQPAAGLRGGLQTGDQILAVNGKPVRGAFDLVSVVHVNAGKEVTLQVRRGGSILEFRGAPSLQPAKGRLLVVTQAPAGNPLGVQVGDQLYSVDGKEIADVIPPKSASLEAAVADLFRERAGKPVTMVVWRNHETPVTLTGPAVPIAVQLQDTEWKRGVFGFEPWPGKGPRISLARSAATGLEQMKGFFEQIFAMFRKGPEGLSQNVGGPIQILVVVGQMTRLPSLYYFFMLGQLSLSLAVFNLFPIPVLDGGHMLILTWEVLRRRRLEPAMLQRVQLVGLAIIAVIFIFIMQKDIRGLLP